MNAVQRFIRSRVLLLTASILIVAMCLSVLVQGQSQAALNRTVDQNSRGLYDILVQAKASSSGALMQPDIATGQGGIGFDQLDAIRKLSGTSVAAPISLVSRVSQNLEAPRLDATDYLGYNAGLAGTAGDPTATDPSKWPAAQSVLSDTPKKYRLTASAVSSNGSSEQTLFKTTAEGTLGKGKLVEEQVAGGKNVRIAGPAGETGVVQASAGGSSTPSSTSPWRCPWRRRSPSPLSPSTPSPNAPCWAVPATSWHPWRRPRPPTPATPARSAATSRASSPAASPWTSSRKAPTSWA